MTHRLLIDYYTAYERYLSCFDSCIIFFVCDSFILVRLKFLLTMLRRKVLITDTDDSQLCNISLYPTLYLITKQLTSKLTRIDYGGGCRKRSFNLKSS